MNNTTIKMALAIVTLVSIAVLWNIAGIVDTLCGQDSRAQGRPINSRDLEAVRYQQVIQSSDGDAYFTRVLRDILIPRVPGTPGQTKVKNLISSEMSQLGYSIQEDAFMANTPQGAKPFYNLIATLNPNACKRLVMSCHFDSKWSKSGRFVGATDSAVPCSMLLQIVRDLDPLLKAQARNRPNDVTLQLMFFDGEESFDTWTSTDSLYGSRHLADLLQRTPVDVNGPCRGQVKADGQPTATELDRIQELVLLDLLGAKNPKFYSFFPETDHLYGSLIRIETKLNSMAVMDKSALIGLRASATSYFKNQRSFGMIEDDHVPFYKRGVKILHVITSPFPSVWHKDSDNWDALDFGTIRNLVKIFKVFVSEYFNLTNS